ncbi:hypothetical protein [Paracoccus sediminicola]|uniref:hypothetical protein n=1 Tax=Paracoccus sediminicola TaxID=3017783 RepID=UPI0022F09333|nr:hypothetical protein [Paracoccus sediminicola]WBU57938.1 hypothetical protein PAF18_05800 [Paracoccus sediminicola]
MLKHRGFPSRLPSTDFQFTIRRANPKGATKLTARERYRDRSPADRRADAGFLAALIAHFGEEEFERGNLDAGRLSWLLGREVVAVGKLDPTDYDQLLRVDMSKAQAGFPEIFADDDQFGEDWEDGPAEDDDPA